MLVGEHYSVRKPQSCALRQPASGPIEPYRGIDRACQLLNLQLPHSFWSLGWGPVPQIFRQQYTTPPTRSRVTLYDLHSSSVKSQGRIGK
jgi:hypothetical protein